MIVHPILQTIRGMLSDEMPHHVIDPILVHAVQRAKDLEEERDRYRLALMDISGYEGWASSDPAPKVMGDIARDALASPVERRAA